MGVRVVCVAQEGKGVGTGHRVRMERLAEGLRKEGVEAGVRVWDGGRWEGEGGEVVWVVDVRRSERGWVRALKEEGVVVALDPDPVLAREADVVLAGLPQAHRERVNVRVAPVWWEVPRREGRGREIRRVLVSFGGEDPWGLTEWVCGLDGGVWGGCEVEVVVGPRFGREVRTGWRVVRPSGPLHERLGDYDLVITSFGLTAYEARKAGVGVLLLNPTAYHAGLGRRAGFAGGRPGRGWVRLLGRVLRGGEEGVWGEGVGGRSAVEVVRGVVEGWGGVGCPGCGERGRRAVWRGEERTVVRCAGCGLEYVLGLGPAEREYGPDYFFEEYRAQYGRTYLEDFASIVERGRERVQVLRRWVPEGGRVLDVGCAYGPFLVAAREGGYVPAGLDVGEDAVAYVRQELGVWAWVGRFEEWEEEGEWDALTMWFVIEHFRRLSEVLDKVARLLKKGGMFAFGTPNARGLSWLLRRDRFYRESPRDHHLLLSVGVVRRLLGRWGMKVVAVRQTGLHPERIPVLGRLFPPGTLRWRITGRLLGLLGLGDTIEIYAKKYG
ncbi:putative methyltransferase [Spirochaeta thermophila DSM 6192]|uniref:Putative methyltransferase n=2 Tax=Winmispira thermophila TaxID=154 RepID=E0RSC2_WINT6|nr:putative methyltransferase [Spirochaeta thermophila DSM 6192]